MKRHSAAAPLVLIWIGLHAAVLMGFLALKFLGLKLVMVTMLLVGTLWFVARKTARPQLVYRRLR